MAATSSRRVVSRRSHERPTSKADDPWCVICGVNLALDGRTFTVVSSHQNPELCDVFLRVLAMTFTSDQAFVNVCNRCERQLKRLGRSTSIAMARQEGRKFRAQVEGNVNKHGLQGVQLGDFRNVNMTKPAVASKPHRDAAAPSAVALRRGDTLDESSGARKSRELYSRSNSSVRAEDKESGKRAAYTRDLSAPERKMHVRDLHSSGTDPTDKTRDVLRGNRSGFQKPGLERTASFKPISNDTKSAVEKRGKSSTLSQQKGPPTRDGKFAIKKMNSVDMPRKSGKLTTGKVARDASKHDASQPREERTTPAGHQGNDTDEHMGNSDLHNDSWELSSGELNPFAADIERENANADTADVFQEDTRDQSLHAFHEFKARDGPMLTDDETFIKNERAVFMESSQSSQSSNQADDDAETYPGDLSRSSPQIHGDLDAPGVPREDEQVRPDEQMTSDEESKDRTKKLRVTFSETVGEDTSHEPLITESVQSTQTRQDSASDKTATDKGKLSKYDSIDLDIEQSNPFFEDVFGEYNRRVAVNKTGVGQIIRRGLHKTEAILESDLEEDAPRLEVDQGTNRTQQINGSVSREDTDSQQFEFPRNRKPIDSHLAAQETRAADDTVRKDDIPGDVQQDSCPLITETEDSTEEHKAVDDVRDQAPGDELRGHGGVLVEDEQRGHDGVLAEDEQRGHDGVLAEDDQRGHDGDEPRVPTEDDTGRATSESARDAGEFEGDDEEHGLIETDRLEQDKATLVRENEDSVRLELTTSSSFLRQHPDHPPSPSSPQSPWLYTVSKVIQVTHLQPPAQLDDVDLKVDEEQTFVKDTADPNGSQVSLQHIQVEDTSAPKSEASPLIDKDEGKGDKSTPKGKDSKFKDQQPGLPCCTIL